MRAIGGRSRRDALKRIAFAAGGATLFASAGTAAKVRSGSRRSITDLRQALGGVHNFMITPFRPNYDLDAEGLRKNVAYHAAGTTENMTIVVGGGLGELFSLDLEEHKAMVTAAVEAARGRMPVVAGAGGGYRLALRMARTAEETGADALLLFSPPYGSESAEGAYQYFRAVASSVRIGIIAFPHGKDDFWPDVLRRLVSVPNVIGFKNGGMELGRSLGSLVPDRLLWVAEGEKPALDAFPAGARAFSSPVAAFVPEACLEFWKRGVAGDQQGMREVLRTRIEPILQVRSVKPHYGISGLKVALEALGRAGGPVRPPGTQVLSEDRAAIGEIARKHSETALISR